VLPWNQEHLQDHGRSIAGRDWAIRRQKRKPMLEGGGSSLLTGNKRWMGPGGESILMQRDADIIVFHAYDATTGHPFLQISTLDWNDGWPSAALDGN